MDTVTFDNKEYTKASVLAKRFGYTADYLGQLCRAKKVDARLIGRAWYVTLSSLEDHRKSRYKMTSSSLEATTETSEISPKKAIYNYLSRVDVEPVLKRKTLRVIESSTGNFTPQTFKYEVDDGVLIPRVQKHSTHAPITVRPAEAKTVSVKTEESPKVTLVAEPLPEVFLQGRISVSGLDETVVEEDDKYPSDVKKNKVNIAISEDSQVKTQGDMRIELRTPKHTIVPSEKQRIIQKKATNNPPYTRFTAGPKRQSGASAGIVSKPSEPVKSLVTTPTPSPTIFHPRSVVAKMPASVPQTSLLLPAASLVFGLLVAAVIVATQQEVLSEGGVQTVQFRFQVASLMQLFSL